MSEQDRIAEARRKLLEKRLKAKKRTPDNAIPALPQKASYRAASGQERLWIVQQLKPESTAYNMTSIKAISGTLDVPKLRDATAQLFARHTIFRTRFVMDSGNLIQEIDETAELPFEHRQIGQDANAAEIVEGIIRQPFDLDTAPLCRMVLLQKSDTESIFVLVIHHIIADEWSLDIFWNELSRLYTSNSAELPTLPIQYPDYAEWQQAQTYQSQADYWRDILKGELPLLQLPILKRRPPAQTFAGRFEQLTIPKSLADALSKLSKQSGVTQFVLLMALFKVILYRYTGQDDVIVGTPITNRNQPELENLIGFFLNTIVLRSDFADDMLFSDYLSILNDQSLNAFSKSEIPFNDVLRFIDAKRDPSYNPVFQAMFVYQDQQDEQTKLGDLQLSNVTVDAKVSKFDLTLFAKSTAHGLVLGVEYNIDLFDSGQMQALLAHYQTLAESVIANPNIRIRDLNILPDTEKQSILDASRGTVFDYPKDALIQHLIEQHPPESPAIQDDYGVTTYGELSERANQLANYLKALGVEPNMPIALSVERSADMLIGILGILKAGGAYVPVDPDYPQDRIAYILEDAGISILLTQEMLTAQFSTTDVTMVTIDNNSRLDMQSTEAPIVSTQSDNLAYIIYTSGSTGRPKGVRVTHRNVVHSTSARFAIYPYPVKRFLLLSSYAFDSSIVGIFWTLCAGGTLCLPPNQSERDVKRIAELIDEYRITHLLALPSLYQILLDFAETSQLETLNTVMVAGEACSPELVGLHYAALQGCKLFNEYGPTEGTVWSTVWEIPPNAETILIGQPIPNMQALILDSELQLVPYGVSGELFIGGDGLAESYHNRPHLTQERFIDHPQFGRLYRTGDLARVWHEGNIEFLGRIDYQVKISGYRIELGEIETVLLQDESISEAIVIPVEQHETKTESATIDTEQLTNYIDQLDVTHILDNIEAMPDDEVSRILDGLLGVNSHDT